MKKKRLTQLDKLKLQISELTASKASLAREVEYHRGRYQALKDEMEEQREQNSRRVMKIERVREETEDEVRWLRDTLRLVIVPKGKEAEIVKLEEEKMRRAHIPY